MSMQVLDIIDKFEGRNIRIGALNGSSFIYLGTVTDNLAAELMEIWGEYKRNFDSKIAKLEKRLAIAKHHLNSFDKESIFYQVTLADVEHIKASLTEYKKSRKACTNFLGREVLEIYPSIFEPSTTIFIIEGLEMGRAWYLGEWLKRNGGKTQAVN